MAEAPTFTKPTITEPVNYIHEIRQMMHGFGDSSEPLFDSAKIIEEVVLQQMRAITRRAYEIADRRASSKKSNVLSGEDLLFLLRRDKVKLRRIIKYLDDIKHQRCIRAEIVTRSMDEIRYIKYSKARRVSFANKNRHKFSDWICTDGDITLSKQAYTILSYLAYETVAQIVDLAFLVRQDQNKIYGDPIDRQRLSYVNPFTYKPYIASHYYQCKGVVTKPLTPSEISEALRRYWSPQLAMTGPFNKWSMRGPHLKLLPC
ncbi:transcription initiation protein SPT3 homolog isoform X3 [Odontomachus brunneus]|uniref:transcription initiation protein SPT3 homolog isoform X3 n=1 Tax=Odontomachus brunneus TaxID=486640 RepID=UPI0013F27B7D|nr:transcription initiation protein SPT3 homolog isoform X3 [Odontomachus brunneus]